MDQTDFVDGKRTKMFSNDNKQTNLLISICGY